MLVITAHEQVYPLNKPQDKVLDRQVALVSRNTLSGALMHLHEYIKAYRVRYSHTMLVMQVIGVTSINSESLDPAACHELGLEDLDLLPTSADKIGL